MSMKIRIAIVALLAVAAGVGVSATAGANPGAPITPGHPTAPRVRTSDFPNRCTNVGPVTDAQVAKIQMVPGASLIYTLPGGKELVLNGGSDPLTVAYAVSRGKLTRMCG